MRLPSTTLRKYFMVGLLLTVGFVTGKWHDDHSTVQADIRRTQPRQSFQSGSERSETYLKEIAGTLKRIESRLVKIENKIKADK